MRRLIVSKHFLAELGNRAVITRRDRNSPYWNLFRCPTGLRRDLWLEWMEIVDVALDEIESV